MVAAAVTKAAALSEETLFKEAPTSSRKAAKDSFSFLFFPTGREKCQQKALRDQIISACAATASSYLARPPPLSLSLCLPWFLSRARSTSESLLRGGEREQLNGPPTSNPFRDVLRIKNEKLSSTLN